MQFLSVEVNLTRDQVIVYNTSAHVWYVRVQMYVHTYVRTYAPTGPTGREGILTHACWAALCVTTGLSSKAPWRLPCNGQEQPAARECGMPFGQHISDSSNNSG